MHTIKCLLTGIMILLLIVVAGDLAGQSNPVYSREVEDRIKQVEQNLGEWIKTDDAKINLQDRMKFYNIPGVSVAVVKDYKIEWARGYGFADREEKIPVTVQTLFQAASISKSLNAVGLLKLAQDKKIDLHADVNNYLNTWKFPYDSTKGKKKISVLNLLSHTAGTSIHGFRGYTRDEKIPSVTQILDGKEPANSKEVRSLFDAGTKVQYSGGGTTILQLLVMDVTKLPYEQYAWKSVLEPLGMTSSFYDQPPSEGKAKFLATGHRESGDAVKGKYFIHPEQAAAGLWTNPTDLCRYIIEMQLAYQGKSSKVLSKEMVGLMFTPVMGDAGPGVFFMTKGTDRYFGHGGSNQGFRCNYFGSIEGGNGVVVMVNSDNAAIMSEIINSVATVYGWKEFYKPEVKQVVSLSEELLDNYVGEYELTGFKIVITREGNKLKGQVTGQPTVDLFAEAEGKFFLKVVNARMEFVKDENNKVSKLILNQNGRTIEGKKIIK